MSSQALQTLQGEISSAFSQLFTFNYIAPRQYETGEYVYAVARGSKRVQSILGIDREILILGNLYRDQQPRSLQFAKKLIAESEGRLETSVCILVHPDPKGNAKLKRWGRENGIAIIPVYTSTGILPRGQELERLLSFEFFTQDPFDITGPVANDAQFFGRRSEAQELARKLQSGQIRSCFGMRKIGKTSILHRILGEIKENYDSVTIFVDCQRDDVFALDASGLLESIAVTLASLKRSGQRYAEVDAASTNLHISKASQQFQDIIEKFDCPVIIAFDEVDYITPTNADAQQWRDGFIEFWRNMRAAYHAAARADRKVSILISGVSSRWFSVESINGIENAALAFVPEEYLSPLPRGASNAMIKNIGLMAGLRFEEAALESISSYCSDMPFWIRKACSYIHGRIEVSVRPIELKKETVVPLLETYGRDEGSALSHVALQHLFRVYPDLKLPALMLLGDPKEIQPHVMRTLCRYGIANHREQISGDMMRAALELVASGAHSDLTLPQDVIDTPKGPMDEWAEELAAISYRRNIIEKTLRSIAVNFIRMSSLGSKGGPSAKAIILDGLNARRRGELEPFNLDAIADKLYWLELVDIISRNWTLFERIFGDKAAFTENGRIINDRPDTHAKSFEPSDIAMHRRALQWMDDRIARI